MQDQIDEVEDLTILQNDKDIAGIAKQKEDSHPTKQKVTAFKNRVFSLLMLFVEKSKNLTPLTESLTKELFMKEPKRMRELLNGLLNRNAVDSSKLIEIAEIYKTLLLYKVTSDSQKYSEDFIKIIRKIVTEDQEYPKTMIQEMLEISLTKRKCKLSQGFWPFILKRLPVVKQAIIEKLLTVEQNLTLRPAQDRVLQKLKNLIIKKQRVKVQQEEQDEDQQE